MADCDDRDGYYVICPYGKPGDELWVRETWNGTESEGIAYRATDPQMDGEPWKPSIFMPRWASRLQLVIKDVRVERLQDISIDDIYAEGAYSINWGRMPGSEHKAFKALWDSINAKRGYGWETNPWVWVVEFEVKG